MDPDRLQAAELVSVLLSNVRRHENGHVAQLESPDPAKVGPNEPTSVRIAFGFVERWVEEARAGFPVRGCVTRDEWPTLARVVAEDLTHGRNCSEPKVIHEWVVGYNWDDGFEPMWPLVEDARTERATALLMYWRVAGPYFEAGPGEATRFHKAVERNLINGFYERRALHYDPVADNCITRTQLYKLRKAKVPDILFEP